MRRRKKGAGCGETHQPLILAGEGGGARFEGGGVEGQKNFQHTGTCTGRKPKGENQYPSSRRVSETTCRMEWNLKKGGGGSNH